MTKEQFKKFCSFRDEFRKQTALWNEEYNKVLKEKIESLSGCEITNSFIYNEKLDEINENDNIKYIWIQDNPGYNEMLQNRYAVGASGKAGQNFMKNEGLAEDFDREVIVLNKSPIHTKVTAVLSKLKNREIQDETQRYMAKAIFTVHNIFECDLWILGISNLKGIFGTFSKDMEKLYKNSALNKKMFLYYHFSQGQFKKAYNLEANTLGTDDPDKILESIGIKNRKKYFDF
ncbi:Uncharacterised protein [Sebaldella termitidis]|jgi:hypothetical protein|uniref:Uracil-DNA glycosylase-like domain-containing protein n=1 Tax=Sebaldella termitidis (strain ATCC 33386 / NCTC 11300) TaxID=526218 RepID=D1AFS1_SEBTE|nr:hypothetical protein [Sebaldella termitidis]ACZ07956.1 hypothetical protein Sterm_1088 [Sebaldella termitidis ATCC 33386]SUI23257.1 Uncharacterised protein [Sebaldella termitidis]